MRFKFRLLPNSNQDASCHLSSLPLDDLHLVLSNLQPTSQLCGENFNDHIDDSDDYFDDNADYIDFIEDTDDHIGDIDHIYNIDDQIGDVDDHIGDVDD